MRDNGARKGNGAGTERGVARTCRTEVVVDAPAEAVWRVVADVTRTSEWSHECHRAGWLAGAASAAPGARFRGYNRSGRLRWSRVCEIVEFEPPHRITWRTVATPLFPDSTDWTIALERSGTRTRVVQTYRMRSTPAWFRWLVGRLVPAHLDRSDDLTGDLRRLGAIAARDAHAAAPRP
ncbi:SRPBCC family protein [Actinacidiphila glaucinigra]|uniref:SRPBCC family protein n=1 Tax=Actinacidiphila glaucinigra TaxID=235986 RepID=UPI0036E97203